MIRSTRFALKGPDFEFNSKDLKQSRHRVQVGIFPHMLRHTRAMHLYRNGMPLNLLSQFLGHSNEETTRIYAYADTEMKRKAMEKADSHRRGAEQATEIWDGDEEMILKLSGLR